MHKKNTSLGLFLLTSLALFNCTKPEPPVGGETPMVETGCLNGSDLSKAPAEYLSALSKFNETNKEYILKVCTEDSDGDGNDDFMVIVSTNVPEHESSYFESDHKHYDDFDYQTNVHKYNDVHDDQVAHSAGNNKIVSQNIVMRMPINPTKASSPTKTTYNTIGLAINGVSFFNEAAGPGDEITDELFTFDQCSGHPQQQGVYHYHVDPVCLLRDIGGEVISNDTTVDGKTYQWIEDSGNNASLFLGMLMDGFPVYGPSGNGEKDCEGNDVKVEIDDFNGHVHCTDEFPNGIFHYHVKTAEHGASGENVFWITNEYYYGDPGSTGNGI